MVSCAGMPGAGTRGPIAAQSAHTRDVRQSGEPRLGRQLRDKPTSVVLRPKSARRHGAVWIGPRIDPACREGAWPQALIEATTQNREARREG